MTAPLTCPYNHFRCSGNCSAVPLTLAGKELITGRIAIRDQDPDTGIWFCGNCLDGLPDDEYLAGFHVCGESIPRAEPEPTREHKTRTTPPAGYNQDADGVRRFDKRGRVMHDKSSFWICTCGEIGAGATRQEARSAARRHREENS